MTTISFWIKDEKGNTEHIYDIENASFNPFKVGNIFYFSVDEIHTRKQEEIRKLEPSGLSEMIIEMYQQKAEDYHIKHYKIISEHISLHQNPNKDDQTDLIIEYKVKEYTSLLNKIKGFKRKIKSKFKK